ncbi:MAG: hypothetical protein PHI23_02125, partial [Candidatus Peribacteraceae bacterium]|nr:hypothetical protein [Candidatus Peribacteraceae bacterium]
MEISRTQLRSVDDALAEAFTRCRDGIDPNEPLAPKCGYMEELQRVRRKLGQVLASAATESIPSEDLERAIHSLGLSAQTVEAIRVACCGHCAEALCLSDADARHFDQEQGRQTLHRLYEGDPW